MQSLIGDALTVIANPFDSAGKLVKDPIGTLTGVVGEGLTSLNDMVSSTFAFAEGAETTGKTNVLGYSLASLLMMWIFWVGFAQRLGLDGFL